ncbi:MAG: WG repeat-containing protein [Ruminococcus sp.]|nr:WG repeat-containing protein [Ruminococcus sp.]
MRKTIAKIMCAVTACVTLLSAPAFPGAPVSAETAGTQSAGTYVLSKPVVVVSLGDSYSSGEGIEPFYGQDLSWEEKVNCEDWLAHRSQLSWPGRLQIPGVSGKLADYKVTGENQNWSDECRWYFAASSGAVTLDFYEDQGKDIYNKDELGKERLHKSVPRQLDVFDTVAANGDTVDYVTMTIGGNDIGFVEIVKCCAGSSYLDPGSKKIDEMITKIWESWDDCYRPNIKGVYESVLRHIGDDAYLIVAGYPKLFEQSGKGALISQYEAQTVNKNITAFNIRISSLIDSMDNSQIVFVDVEEEFDGHEAYSDDPWIREITISKQDEDLEQDGIGSAYSMHPTDRGAQAYADCVNAEIAEIEAEKAEQSGGEAVYGITGAEWVVDPTIEADDIIVGDKFSFGAGYSCPYVYIESGGKYGLIDYDGNIEVEPEYDSFNGGDFYGLDDFVAVYDSKSGDSMFAQNYNTSDKGKWEIVEQKKAFGQPGIGTWSMTYFIDENDGELYRYGNLGYDQPEEITDGPDTSYVVQKIDCVPAKYGIGDSSASDEKFYLYNDSFGYVTDGYKYVYSNGYGVCTYSGGVGERYDVSGYKTVAFSNDMKKWDIYDSYGELIASGLEPFGCNLDLTPWWSPATAFFDDSDDYDSAENTRGKAVPFCATEGYIAAKIDGKCGYLDIDGNVVVEFGILDDVRPVHNGKAWAKFEGKWGVLQFDDLV